MFIHCPKCQSIATVPIAYGKPGSELLEAEQYGLVLTKGCCVDELDRHCRRCGYEWCSNPDPDHTEQLQRLVKGLESRLQMVHESCEQECMNGGRSRTPKSLVSSMVRLMGQHHEAWDLFLDGLANIGPEIHIRDDKGNLITSYSVRTARVYVVKHSGFIYENLALLAQSCYDLGSAKTVDEAKRASVAVAQARESIRELWQQMRRAAIGQ